MERKKRMIGKEEVEKDWEGRRREGLGRKKRKDGKGEEKERNRKRKGREKETGGEKRGIQHFKVKLKSTTEGRETHHTTRNASKKKKLRVAFSAAPR